MSTPQIADKPYGWRANDLTLDEVRPLLGNFITKFTPGRPDECWLWAGQRMANGYGILGRSYLAALLAHRVSYVAFSGNALLDNLTIDHLCGTLACVNPGHLEPVTLRENVRRKYERLGLPHPKSPKQTTTGRVRELGTGKTGRVNAKIKHLPIEAQEAHRKAVKEKRDAAQEACAVCGVRLRHDGMRRHLQRMHSGAR